MKESTIDIILHPVRMRIIQNLINQELTSQQLKELLPDIPQASLYRHIKKLLDAKLIYIVDEIPIRGTVEKVYTLYNPNISINPEEMKKLSKDEHMAFFMKYMANIMGEYDRYLDKGNLDFAKDGVAFRQTSLFMTDEEFVAFTKDLVSVFAKAAQNKPNSARRRRSIATIIIPGEMNEE